MLKEQTEEAIFSQFAEIEQGVDQLIKKVDALETENNNCKIKIAELEKEVKEKNIAEKKYLEEKTKVREKIEALLEKLGHFTGTG